MSSLQYLNRRRKKRSKKWTLKKLLRQKKNPKGTLVNNVSYKVTPKTDSLIEQVGHYDFEVNGETEGSRKTVHARFIFEWRRTDDGEWGIDLHSSDLLPATH